MSDTPSQYRRCGVCRYCAKRIPAIVCTHPMLLGHKGYLRHTAAVNCPNYEPGEYWLKEKSEDQ